MHHSVNQGALEVVKEILDREEELRCIVKEIGSGTTLIDAGIDCVGTLELGRLIGETCLGGLGVVRLTRMFVGDLDLPAVIVSTEQPKIATLGSQYAGWNIRVGKYHAMGSGPARALAMEERELYEAIDYHDTSKESVIILETRKAPTDEVTAHIAERCGVAPSSLYCITLPTASVAGSVQSSSRVVGVGLHKLHQIGFDLNRIKRGHGVAPVAPVAKSDNRGRGLGNDCIMYGGRTFYHVDKDSDDLREIVERLPSSTSSQYGRPFYDLFKSVGSDINRVDPLLFGPAEVTFNHIESGAVYHAGGLNPEVLHLSLGI
jgi:methenyltetrahydromethanopterin cyclohydrolase